MRFRANKVRAARLAAKGGRVGAYVLAIDGRVHITPDHKVDRPKTLCGRAVTGQPSPERAEWPPQCPTCRDHRRALVRGEKP